MCQLVTKRFNKELYEQNDGIARQKIRDILKDTEYNVVDNPKKRGVDLLIYKKGKHVLNIECEIKRVWKGETFPYESLQIPARKEKYAILDVPTVFVVLNDDKTSYLSVTGDVLVNSPKKEVPNKYVYKGEYFFQVPLDKVKYNDLLSVVKDIAE